MSTISPSNASSPPQEVSAADKCPADEIPAVKVTDNDDDDNSEKKGQDMDGNAHADINGNADSTYTVYESSEEASLTYKSQSSLTTVKDESKSSEGNGNRRKILIYESTESLHASSSSIASRTMTLTEVKVDGWVIKSDFEANAVANLHLRLKNVEKECLYYEGFDISPLTLIRFARARKFNLDLAEKMFRDALEWRKTFKPQKYIPGGEEYTLPRIFKDYWPGGYCGTDKEGSPVYYDRAGKGDVDGILKKVKDVDEFIKFWVYKQNLTYERLKECSTSERPQYQILIVEDLKGLSMKKHFRKRFFKLLQKLFYHDDHYFPERVKKVIVVNAPVAFDAIWNIVKFFLDVKTRKKISIYSGKGQKHLLDHIHKDQLPTFLGGAFVDAHADPECKAYINAGGLIPDDLEFHS